MAASRNTHASQRFVTDAIAGAATRKGLLQCTLQDGPRLSRSRVRTGKVPRATGSSIPTFLSPATDRITRLFSFLKLIFRPPHTLLPPATPTSQQPPPNASVETHLFLGEYHARFCQLLIYRCGRSVPICTCREVLDDSGRLPVSLAWAVPDAMSAATAEPILQLRRRRWWLQQW